MADRYLQGMPARFVSALEVQSPGQSWCMDGLPLATFILLAAVLTFAALAFMRCRRPRSLKHGPGVLRLPRQAAANNEWWTRVQWALEATTSGSERKYSYGVSLLIVLAKSRAAGPEEKAMLDAVWKHSKTRMKDPDILHLMEHVSVREVVEGVSTPVPLAHTQDMEMLRGLKSEILAARLKVVLDEQLGRETSQTVYQLSEMKLPRPLSPPG